MCGITKKFFIKIQRLMSGGHKPLIYRFLLHHLQAADDVALIYPLKL